MSRELSGQGAVQYGFQGMTNVVKGRAVLRDDGAFHTLKALAFHSDIMKKSIEKAGFPVLGDSR